MNDVFRHLALATQRRFNKFDPSSFSADPSIVDGNLAPVFILSPPRSGSTLLYQAMCRTVDVAYISNLMSLLPDRMVRLARLTLARRAAPDAPYPKGEYGYLPGLFAPSEAGKVVDRWFDTPTGEEHREAVRRQVAAISLRTGHPLLIKSPSLALRIDAVLETFPEARIVVLRRSAPHVVQSLMKGQTDPALASDRWEGIQPPGLSEHAARSIEWQTAWQIAELERIVLEGVSGVRRRAEVAYEEFCETPGPTLSGIGDSLGLTIRTNGMPASFRMAQRQTISDEAWQRVVAACEELGV